MLETRLLRLIEMMSEIPDAKFPSFGGSVPWSQIVLSLPSQDQYRPIEWNVAALGEIYLWSRQAKAILGRETSLTGLLLLIIRSYFLLLHPDGVGCWCDAVAQLVGVNLGKFGAEKKDLRRVIDPEEKRDE